MGFLGNWSLCADVDPRRDKKAHSVEAAGRVNYSFGANAIEEFRLTAVPFHTPKWRDG